MASFTVSGLNGDNYLINNPIWVDVTGLNDTIRRVHVVVKTLTEQNEIPINTILTFKYLVINNEMYFDIAEIIKSLMASPKHLFSFVNGSLLGSNTLGVSIDIQAVLVTGIVSEMVTYSRTFVRGGEESGDTNVYLGNNTVLKESTLIPRWNGFQVVKYVLENNVIKMYTIIPNIETEQRVVAGCNPLYFRFLNTKGGYSYWLFETWDVRKKADKAEIIERKTAENSLGSEVEYSLTVESTIPRSYYKTMLALCQSPEVYVYGLYRNTISGSAGSYKFDKIHNGGNTFEINSYEDVKKTRFKFDMLIKQNSLVIW